MSAINCMRAVCSLSVAALIGQLAAVEIAAAQTNAPALVLKRDTAKQNAGTISEIDVLANDELPAGFDVGAIEVIAQPQCGVVTAHPGRVTYQTFPECDGPQVFYYGFSGSPAFAEVTVVVHAAQAAAAPEPTLTFGMAVIERTPPVEARPEPVAPPANVARAAPATTSGAVTIRAPVTASTRVLAAPAKDPALAPAPAPVLAAIEPNASARNAQVSVSQPAGGAASCAIAPEIATKARPAALTQVAVTAPCLANSVAELRIGDLSLGLALDAKGQGALTVPGFEPVAQATLAFADGSSHELELKFFGLSQIDRMAVAWNSTLAFELNALEFGAERGTAGHLYPAGNPRSYDDVRRAGGGFLMTYEPVQGVGQSLQFYTHVAKPGGKAGVVRFVLDHERTAFGAQAACGAASPSEILVLVSNKGELAQSARHSPAALGCAPSGLDQIELGDLVGNVVIR